MNAFLTRGSLLLAFAVAGCAAGSGDRGGQRAAGIEVMRTHLGQPIARGQIAVEAFDPADANNPEFGSYAAAVGQQLSRLGWTVLPTRGQSEQVALVDVIEGSPASGAGSATTLDVRIKRRSEGSVFWQGRATSQARSGTSAEQRTAAVRSLAEAVFRDFPGESGRTIRLR